MRNFPFEKRMEREKRSLSQREVKLLTTTAPTKNRNWRLKRRDQIETRVGIRASGPEILSSFAVEIATAPFEIFQAIFEPPKAIYGGIPICFPQFSNVGTLEQHGFARNRLWTIINSGPPPLPINFISKAFVNLILKPSEDLKIWPHSFEVRLRASLGPGGDVMITSRIRNTDTKPFSFNEVRVEGLEALDYQDNLHYRERCAEQGDAITFEGEIAITDHEKKRTFVILKDGLPDSVVWNPWDKKAKAMIGFGDEEYKDMLCVESAVIEKSITLQSCKEWKGRQELSAVPSSYCNGQLNPQKVLQS